MRKMRAVCALLAVFLLFSGCGKGEKKRGSSPGQSLRGSGSGEYEVITTEETLSGIFREESLYNYAEDGFRTILSVYPYYDAEAGTMTVLARREMFAQAVAGETLTALTTVEELRLVTLAEDGEVLSAVDVPAPETDSMLNRGVVTEDGLLWMSYRYDIVQQVWLHYWTEGEPTPVTIGCEALYEEVDDPLQSRLAYDGQGVVLAAAGDELAVLNGQLERQYLVKAAGEIASVGFSDGTPAFSVRGTQNTDVYTVDPMTQRDSLVYEIPGLVYAVLFTDGGQFLWQDRDGLWTRDGEESKLLLNTRNSAISEEMILFSAVDEECVIYQSVSRDESKNGFSLYCRAPDLDLSAIKTIVIAATNRYDRNRIDDRIAAYNRTHPDVRVVVTDFSDARTLASGVDGLTFNIVNGFYQPDIVLTTPSNTLTDALLSKKLYVDLLPYLEKDPDIRADDLFQTVRTAFTDEDGGLWGITPSFDLRTVTARRDILGKFAKDGTWTLTDFYEFAAAQPKDRALSSSLTQESADVILGATGYNRWIDYDAMTCDFTDGDFAEFLRFAKTLPKDWDDLARRYPFVNAEDYYEPYREGNYALAIHYLNGIYGYLNQEMQFGTPDLLRIGYPSSDGMSANFLSSNEVCVIMKSCADPDAAWDLIRTFFAVTDDSFELLDSPFEMLLDTEFPATKSAFAAYREAFGANFIVTDPTTRTTAFPEKGADPEQQKKVYAKTKIVYDATPELLDEIEAMLDGDGGTRVIDYTPSEITDIVNEEISAYLGRGTSEEDCAAKIQSRVSIWLAEHR